MIAKLLIGWGVTVLGILLTLFLVAAFADSYGRGGWPSVAVLSVVLSAFPALFLGLWLSTR